MHFTINDWVNDTINTSNSKWWVLTFRCDGSVTNGHFKKQSVWNDRNTCSIEKVKTALSWTITEFRRKYGRDLKFVAYLGGEQSSHIYPHIHALLKEPKDMDALETEIILERLWKNKLNKTLKTYIRPSVYIEILESSEYYTRYCGRWEGNTFNFGDAKVLLNKSFNL